MSLDRVELAIAGFVQIDQKFDRGGLVANGSEDLFEHYVSSTDLGGVDATQ